MIDSEIEMKELGRKHPTNTHSKRSLIRTSHVCHRRRAAGRNHQVEEYKHTHTHTPSASKSVLLQCLQTVKSLISSNRRIGEAFFSNYWQNPQITATVHYFQKQPL